MHRTVHLEIALSVQIRKKSLVNFLIFLISVISVYFQDLCPVWCYMIWTHRLPSQCSLNGLLSLLYWVHSFQFLTSFGLIYLYLIQIKNTLLKWENSGNWKPNIYRYRYMLLEKLSFPHSFPHEFSRSLYPVGKINLLSKRAHILRGNSCAVSLNSRSINSK